MSTVDPKEAQVKQVFATLVKLRERCLTQQLDVIAQDFPELVDDAQFFVSHVHLQPWELMTLFREGNLGELLEKYAVRPSRQRPSASHVAPEVHLFYEACQLVEEKERLEQLRELLKHRWLPPQSTDR